MSRVANRARTVVALIRHFAAPGRWFLIPMLLVLLLAGLLLVLTAGVGYVAPFVYALF